MALSNMHERARQSPQAWDQGRVVEQVKATLEFDLPDDQWHFKAATEATDTLSGLLDLRDKVRSRLKHGPEPDTEFVEEIYQELIELT